jgi:peptidoglycan/LPS O-acetylase OafA/YrhL
LQRFFSCPISRFLGRISFSLYLIHLPIIAVVYSTNIYEKLLNGNLYTCLFVFIISSLVLVLSIFCAYIFTLVVEEFILGKIKRALKLLGEKDSRKVVEPQLPLIANPEA